MQSNTITLPVDVANNGTTVDENYSRHEEHLNRSVYIAADHSMTSRNTLGFYRTPPNPSGNFRGVGKTAVKFTQDFGVQAADGVSTITQPAIVEVNLSVPVGVSTDDVKALRQRVVALLDDDSIMDDLQMRQSI